MIRSIIAVLVLILTTPGCANASTGVTDVTLTFYGYPDNTPPGTAIHWPGPSPRHGHAGGVGTYDDPTTVAVRKGSRWDAGTRMYLPHLQRYLIVEDSCASCGTNHIDVWAGGDGTDDAAVLACERALTPPGTVQVEIDPSDGKPVNTAPLC